MEDEEKFICCGHFEKTMKFYQWFELEENGEMFLVVPCFPKNKVRVNYCPVCGASVRNVLVPVETFKKYQ